MIPTRGKVRVLFVDDTIATQRLCGDRLARENDLQILEILADPGAALRRIKAENPDVVVLDIENSRGVGGNCLALLKQIMADKPTPVVIFSQLSSRTAMLGIDAMSAGALATVKKPQTTLLSSLQEAGLKLSAAIREASRASFRAPRNAAPTSLHLDARTHAQPLSAQTRTPLHPTTKIPTPTPIRSTSQAPGQNLVSTPRFAHLPSSHATQATQANAAISFTSDGIRMKNSADAMLAAKPGIHAMPGGDKLIAIGSSTGGTQALEVILTQLPANCAGIVIVQHMPEKFTAMFATRLNDMCKVEVKEAAHGDKVQRGKVFIAPGGKHMMIKRSGAGYHLEIADGPLVNRHKPSVDLMFRSVAQAAGASALGFILTGMGDDGARGMKEMHDAGASTVAQDEFSCVVFGMPKVAISMGGVDKIVPLDKIAHEITSYGH